VHLFRPSLSFLAEAQPRLDNRRGQKVFLEDRTNYKAQNNLWKNYKFILNLPFSNR
jgi:hypothetical protein